MEKAISFSKEQKNLIWQRFVQPAGGTEPEVKQFIEICETFGLNPLLGDIVFQRYETRNGPRTNFITTRDGLLRVASQQPDYVGPPIANVVKEGDDFEFVPSEGDVVHKFGKKRGGILGAYAIMRHKRFHTVSVFVDFEEYFKANSLAEQQKAGKRGGSPIWDSMPSAMIQKVAEVFVLKRQFPLGGLVTAEELGIDDFDKDEGDVVSTKPIVPPQKPSSGSSDQSESKSKEGSNQKDTAKDQAKTDQKKEEPQKEEKKKQEEKTARQQNETRQQNSDQKEQKGKFSESKGGQYTLEKYESGKSKSSGIPFAKLTVKDQESGETFQVLAKEQEAVDAADQIPEDQPFDMDIREENGFYFLEAVNGNKVKRAAS